MLNGLILLGSFGEADFVCLFWNDCPISPLASKIIIPSFFQKVNGKLIFWTDAETVCFEFQETDFVF